MEFCDCCSCWFIGHHYIDNDRIDYIEVFKVHMKTIEHELNHKNINKTAIKDKIKNILSNYEMILRGHEKVCECDCHKYSYIRM